MQKEIYQILENVIKTAGVDQNFVNIRTDPANTSLQIIEATDSKRAVYITLENSTIKNGQYDIGKVGKDYQFILRATQGMKFPDIKRTIPKDDQIKFTREIGQCSSEALFGYVCSVFGFFQAAENPKANSISTILLPFLEVLKPWSKINDLFKFSAVSPVYPVMISSEMGSTTIKYVVMPYGNI